MQIALSKANQIVCWLQLFGSCCCYCRYILTFTRYRYTFLHRLQVSLWYYRNTSAYPYTLCNYLFIKKKRKKVAAAVIARCTKPNSSDLLLLLLFLLLLVVCSRCLQFNVIFICRFGSYCSYFDFFYCRIVSCPLLNCKFFPQR